MPGTIRGALTAAGALRLSVGMTVYRGRLVGAGHLTLNAAVLLVAEVVATGGPALGCERVASKSSAQLRRISFGRNARSGSPYPGPTRDYALKRAGRSPHFGWAIAPSHAVPPANTCSGGSMTRCA